MFRKIRLWLLKRKIRKEIRDLEFHIHVNNFDHINPNRIRKLNMSVLTDEMIRYVVNCQYSGEELHILKSAPYIWRFVSQLSNEEINFLRMRHLSGNYGVDRTSKKFLEKN